MSNIDRFSVLLEPGDHVNTKDLTEWLEDEPLTRRLRLNLTAPLALTPLIGYGMLQVEADEEIPWDSTFGAEIESRYPVDSEERGFLENVVHSRIGDKDLIEDYSASPELTTARLALFDLAFHATKILVRSWDSYLMSVTNWSKHSIPLSDDLTSELVDSVSDAVEALKKLPVPDGGADLLGGSALHRRLARVGTEVHGSGQLDGTAVEYCTQAFWHIMTFDAPLYPRYDELAFQVSLCLGSTSDYPHRRAAPPTSVQRTAFVQLSNCVARSVDRGYRDARPDPSERDLLYQSLAKVLHASFDYFTHEMRTPSPFATEQEAEEKSDETHAITLTTNFDLELERALALVKQDAHYHVAIPVFVAYRDDAHARASLRWVVGAFATIEASDTALSKSKLTEPVIDDDIGGWRWFDNLRPGDLKGPLVIKLSGSPCHSLPQRLYHSSNLRDGHDALLHHATLLDEIDFIQAVQAETAIFINALNPMSKHGGDDTRALSYGLPEWLYNSLRIRSRMWLLCGTRLADWTLRLHLFMQLSRLAPHASGRFFDVAKDVGDDRAHLLRWLGVSPLRGDCKELTGPLTKLAEQMETLS